MNFYSWTFLYFVVATFLLYWLPIRSKHYQNIILIIASYLFFGWNYPMNAVFLASITLVSYCGGLLMKARPDKILLSLLIILIAAPLVIFKYSGYLHEVINTPDLSETGMLKWIIPIGMSFITFACIGYVVDCYRRTIEAEKHPITYFSYISFFPHLLIGPIPDAKTILPQFRTMRSFPFKDVHEASSMIVWGLFKKLVIADNISLAANYCFAQYDGLNGSTLLCGVLLFGFQVYADFSGYSDMMKGIAKFFGIELHWNFKLPFFSRNPREFWRRWHISLQHWLKNYIYLPLGGHSSYTLVYMFAVLFTFTFSGLWHGANTTFVLWGFTNGLIFLPYFLMGQLKTYHAPVATGKWLPSFKELILMIATFNLINFTRVMFKSPNMQVASDYYNRMFSSSIIEMPAMFIFKELKWCLLLIAIEWIQRERRYILDVPSKNIILRWSLVLLIVVAIIFWHRSYSMQEHYYFRF